MIRTATMADLEFIVNIAGEFATQVDYGKFLTYSPEKVEALAAKLIEDSSALVLVFPGGVFVGCTTETLCHHEKVATELLFYIQPAFRGLTLIREILDKFETWAKSQNAHMTVFHLVGEETQDSFLKRRGFRPYEHSYYKEH